jgi:hypothetical protein
MAEFTGFDDLSSRFIDLADDFDRIADDNELDEDTAKGAIRAGIDNAMDVVVEDARALAPEDTGRLAASLSHRSEGWSGGRYRHWLGSSIRGEYPAVQEFGTRKTNYLITPNGDWPLRFYWEKAGVTVRFQYVVHPGVEGSHFMRDALESNEQVISGSVGGYIKSAMDEVG